MATNMERDIGRIEGILSDVVASVNGLRESSDSNFNQLYRLVNKIDAQGCAKAPSHVEFEHRLRKVEVFQGQWSGIAITLGLIAGAVATSLIAWIRSLFSEGGSL